LGDELTYEEEREASHAIGGGGIAKRMSYAYACFLIGEDRQLAGRRDFRAGSNEEAIGMAEALSSENRAHGFELWEGLRQIHKEGVEAAENQVALRTHAALVAASDRLKVRISQL
jgi:hypothetical protein